MIECLQKVFETIIKVIIGAFFSAGKYEAFINASLRDVCKRV